MLKKCPRCNEMYPIQAFQEPLSFCLVCYGRIPANAGLNLDQLREKAMHSFHANRRQAKSAAKDFARVLLGDQAFYKLRLRAKDGPLDPAQLEDVELDPMECDLCGVLGTKYDTYYYEEKPVVACDSCKMEKQLKKDLPQDTVVNGVLAAMKRKA